MDPSSGRRFDGVDLLRGLSIIAVVLLHVSGRMRAAGFSMQPQLPPRLFYLLFWNGGNGVTMFFAISGFLITLTSIRRFGSLAQMQPKNFYRIRFARIAPLLLLLLAVLSVLHLVNAEGFHILPQRSTLPRALFAALTFHLNWLEAVHGYLPANWDVLWSLSIEETFYLLFPLVCVLVLPLRNGMRLFAALLLALIVMGPFARTVWSANQIWQGKSYLGGMDAIAAGCLSALFVNRALQWGPGWRIRFAGWLRSLEFAGAAMILLIAVWPHWRWVMWLGHTGLDSTVLAAATCLVIIATVVRGSVSSRWTAPIRWFGRHSYEVYLTHEFVVVWGTAIYVRLHRGPLPVWIAGILLISAALGAVTARCFSDPLNRKLRGVSPRALPAFGLADVPGTLQGMRQ